MSGKLGKNQDWGKWNDDQNVRRILVKSVSARASRKVEEVTAWRLDAQLYKVWNAVFTRWLNLMMEDNQNFGKTIHYIRHARQSSPSDSMRISGLTEKWYSIQRKVSGLLWMYTYSRLRSRIAFRVLNIKIIMRNSLRIRLRRYW